MHETLETLRAFPAQLLATLSGMTEEALRRPEGEGKWSVAGVIAHLADLELVYAVRMRTIVAGAGSGPLPGLAQDAWVAEVHRDEPVSELLEQFQFDRERNLRFVERLDAAALAREGQHPEYGAMTVPMALERIVRHDARHLRQIERIWDAG
jgi:uncharacterized damage-inducible protein DinB